MGSNLNLYTLPTELQHHIVLNLHPSAAIALKQTNRYFHTHISLYRLDPLKVKQYLHQVELRPRHRENYACFSCLRVKPKIAFTVSQLGAKKSRNGAYSSGRFCIDCGVRDKRFKPGTVLDIAGDESHPKAFCRSCSTIQSYFCGKCRWCAACIARTKSFKTSWSRSVGMDLCQTHLQGISGTGIGQHRASTSSLGLH